MSEWQPIETAPKDGTHVLVCQATDDAWGVFMQVAAWWVNEDAGTGAWMVYCSIPDEPELHFEPTHWMPLPVAPPGPAEEAR